MIVFAPEGVALEKRYFDAINRAYDALAMEKDPEGRSVLGINYYKRHYTLWESGDTRDDPECAKQTTWFNRETCKFTPLTKKERALYEKMLHARREYDAARWGDDRVDRFYVQIPG